MDSYLMDFVIKYWKQDPELGLVYHSGGRVLLSPLFITVKCAVIFPVVLVFSSSMPACMVYSFFMSFFCSFSMQYVLQIETFVKRDDEGNPVLPVVHSSFVLEDAVN